MPESHRERLLAEIQRVFVEAVPSDTGGGTTFSKVLDSPIAGLKFKGANLLGLIEGTETYLDVVSPDKRDRRLEVDLQARVYIPLGTSLRTGANNVLADMEELIEDNRLWAGLAYGTFFLANTVEIEDNTDRAVEVTLFIAVQYRTKRTDPRA